MAPPVKRLVDRPVKVTTSHGQQVLGTLRVHEWSPEERTSRVWKRLGMWWGGALLAIVMPPHFLWVTLGLLGGPIAAWLASRQGAMVQAQDVACPACGTLSHVEETAETWPLGARCSPCRSVFWIDQVASPTGV